MLPEQAKQALERYRQLLEKVDRFSAGVALQLAAQLSCRPGCDSCCQLETVFPLEAWALDQALRQLPAEILDSLRDAAVPGGACPLLLDGRCSVYNDRPLICRSHGLPLLIEEQGVTRIDHCPLNFAGLESIPGALVLKLEAINQPLVAINRMFVQQLPDDWSVGAERIALVELLQRAGRDLQSGPDVV
jgi:uncharacterized protein